ncbi:homeobox domain protein [Ancylostoma duodenale]|uniref:Homeobox domain protein n=1 Tax=Ancylostoma duodenale TaxID=51022 RepID=A0A0C2DY43_9BILA|nr:homeobox domain protein [Ancylostoma duodenale]
MLRALDNPVLPIEADDEMDEESQKLERTYVKKMEYLRKLLYSNILHLQKNFEDIEANMRLVLRDQQILRPIYQQDVDRAVDSIRRKHELMELETKQIVANKVMGFQAKIADVTKRRRNFSKEATAILQEYYENHLAHPYPTEEEKAVLAEKCHISVQQVQLSKSGQH